MPEVDKPRDFNRENRDATGPRARPSRARDDTATTEQVQVEPNPDAPFALPHVSELDEVTPRDARREAGQLVTLPAYNQIAREQAPERTRRNPPASSALGRGAAKGPYAMAVLWGACHQMFGKGGEIVRLPDITLAT